MQERPVECHIVRTRSDAPASDRAAGETRTFVIEDSIGYVVQHVAKHMLRVQARCLGQYGVALGQWPVLMFLWVDDGMSQTQLSRYVAIDDATMVRTLDRMERDGLVHRQRNRHDRRQINIHLSERGRALRDMLIPCAIATNAAATQDFSGAEYEQLLEFLRRMLRSLEQASLAQDARNEV